MITVKALNRTYGALHAVNNVNFHIEQGEVIGLLGPNGAGKTTIMKMLCGFLEPSSGSITINGCNIADDTKSAQAQIGYLPENLPVYPEMTVVGYLEYAAQLRGIADSQRATELKRVIDATDLNAKAFEKIHALSRGLKQRVGVAQALLGNPKVLVLDEPTNGLDPSQTLQMRKLIRKLSETATVILSTHILSEVEAVCDRVLMVKSGQLVLDEKLQYLQKGNTLELHTSLNKEALRKALNESANAGWEFTSENGTTIARAVPPSSNAKDFAATVARAVIQAEGDLFHLGFVQRDLESLFRELNNNGEVAHAA